MRRISIDGGGRAARWLAGALLLAGCGTDLGDTDTDFGDTAAVVVLNPVANAGNTAATPSTAGSQRAGVVIEARPGGSATTDAAGIAILRELAVGPLEIQVGTARIELDVAREGDVSDLAVAYNAQAAAIYPGFPVTYSVGGQVVQVAPGVPLGDAPGQSGTTIVLDAGTHTGSISVTGNDVLLYGQGLAGNTAVIAGNVEVRGTGVRLRGVTVTGNLTVTGSDFAMAHSTIQGQLRVEGSAPLLLANAVCQQAQITGTGAVLYGNSGLDAGLPAPGARCQ